ncbi:hypothetical protein ACVNS2_32680 [Paenibacillus caseinilyticus]|uniref:Uncharacterized protein n=1 Tax=Paenibacillus mucilaginosus (strain KNP414) TaxID=1036673 RepID=F8FGR6_PAEMK|nr:hypothetical protein [Paenibacillus mucilaginosus]AEI45443.1 hypothetical protein KNP414_06931 [Paenibacillus mucilaginosus KNP414]
MSVPLIQGMILHRPPNGPKEEERLIEAFDRRYILVYAIVH